MTMPFEDEGEEGAQPEEDAGAVLRARISNRQINWATVAGQSAEGACTRAVFHLRLARSDTLRSTLR